jgi:hypothetical protein
MDWRCSSSGRVPALQTQVPEFKPSPTEKKIYDYLQYPQEVQTQPQVDTLKVRPCG